MWRAILALATALLLANIAMLSSQRRPKTSIATAFTGGSDAGPADKRATVYVVFQAADCQIAMQKQMAVWNDIHHRQLADVRGILLGAPPDTAIRRQVLNAGGVHIPVQDGAAGEIGDALRQLGYSTSLVAVVVDPAGRVRLVLPWHATDSMQVARLLHLIEPESQ